MVHRCEEVADDDTESIGDFHPPQKAVVFRILEIVGIPQPFTHCMPLTRRHDDKTHITCLATKDLVDRPRPVSNRGAVLPLGFDHRAIRVRPIRLPCCRLEHRKVDRLPETGLFSLVDRGHRSKGTHDPADVIGHRSGREQWLAIGCARLALHPGDRTEGRVRRDPIPVRARLPEIRDRKDDQMREALGEARRIKPQFGQPTGRLGFDEHVRA